MLEQLLSYLQQQVDNGSIYVLGAQGQTAAEITKGYQAWLAAIPEPIVQLFGVVMVGYIGGRSWEKVRGASK